MVGPSGSGAAWFPEEPSRPPASPPAPPAMRATTSIPLSAALILRNIARNGPKTHAQEELLKQHERGGEGGGYNERLFRLMRPRLAEIMTKNEALVRATQRYTDDYAKRDC